MQMVNKTLFDDDGDKVVDIGNFAHPYRQRNGAPKKLPTPRNDNQREFVRIMENSDISFGSGPAGTGKTYLAVATAVKMLKERKCDRLILTRPAVESGESLGFLPGDLEDKVAPYLRPLYDCLFDFLGPKAVPAMVDQKIIEICPLAYMRGRTFNGAVVILDEAQNATRTQLKMAMTRIGQSSRMIVTGDPQQYDLPEGESGLGSVLEDLEGAPGIGIAHFERGDIVRSRIVRTVLDRLGE